MLISVDKYETDVDESTMLLFQLMRTVSGAPDILDFINVRPGDVLFRRLKTR